ncbi:MAG: hypothetical protein EAX90_03185 [Candidatus Heimdallarchaeota archaeon]|nr:hypothetical protein [Candidatus Heimdallarchaeota archaeon]
MEVSIKTLDDYGFLLCFIGGVLTVVTALLMFIVSVSGGRIHWFFGAGYIGIASEIAGSIVCFFFGTLAIVIGLKLFSRKIWEVITKIDLIITAIVMIVISVVAFGIGGLIILAGGILVLIYRLKPEGTTNPTGK